jgi:hypothetical protein
MTVTIFGLIADFKYRPEGRSEIGSNYGKLRNVQVR